MLPTVNQYTIYLRILSLPVNGLITSVASMQYFLDFKSFLVSQRTYFSESKNLLSCVAWVQVANDPGQSQHVISPFSLQPLPGVPHKMLLGAAFCTSDFEPSEPPFYLGCLGRGTGGHWAWSVSRVQNASSEKHLFLCFMCCYQLPSQNTHSVLVAVLCWEHWY